MVVRFGIAALLVSVLALLSACPAFAADARAVRARLAQTKAAAEAAAGQLTPAEQALLLLASFEQPGSALLGGGAPMPLKLTPDHYRDGKFGKGFFFEMPRHNLLPAATADVEEDLAGFTPVHGGTLQSEAAETAFGTKALAVTLPAAGSGVATLPVTVVFNRHAPWATTEVFLLGSCYVKGPQGTQLKIEMRLAPLEPLDPKTKQPLTNPKADVSQPQQITLTGAWQRVACWASGDARLTERQGTFTLTSEQEAAVKVLVDGLQFQQANYTANGGFVPTTWIAGGQSAPACFVDLTDTSLIKQYPTSAGTACCWMRAPNPLGGAFFSFDAGWNKPWWSLDTYQPFAGKGKGPAYYVRGLKPSDDGNWHHLALAWDAGTAAVYLDGKRFGSFEREDIDMSKLLDSYHLRLGGNIHGTSANAVLDDFAIFNRRLADAEIAEIAGGKAPLRMTALKIALAGGARRVFYRDETRAQVEAVIKGLELQQGTLTVDSAIGELIADSTTVTMVDGQAVAKFTFAASSLKVGSYLCRLGATAPGGVTAYTEFPLEIVPALRRDQYLLSTWGNGFGEDYLDFYKTLGLNCISTPFTNAQALNAMGKEGFLFNWHYNFGSGDFSPANRPKVQADTRAIAEQLAPFPNWRGSLLNTEAGPGGLPSAEGRKAWFDGWAQEKMGMAVPPDASWKLLTPHNPNLCYFPAEQKPGDDGVFKEAPPSVQFVKWWYNWGGTIWRLNTLAAGEMKALRPDLLTWTDPMSSAGEIAELDAGSTWSYSTQPEDIIGELYGGYTLTRAAGAEKEYYATLGMDYVAGDWLAVTDAAGKKQYLSPTADDAIQQAWIAVAHLPSDGLTYWLLDGWFCGLRGAPLPWEKPDATPRYAPPGCDTALGDVLKRDLLPLGTMLKHAQNAPRPVALLLPDSTVWLNAGEGKWHWSIAHYIVAWQRWLNQSGIPYDTLNDEVKPGELATYRAVVFPMGLYVSHYLRDELTAAGKAGTKIIVDNHGRQTYPNMEKWPISYQHPAYQTPEYHKPALERLAALRTSLLPTLDAYGEGAEAPVFVNTRTASGIRYISVINDNRVAGPYTEWTKKPNFKPYGKAQQATISIKAPAGSVVYEFTTAKKLPTTVQEGRLVVTIDLPPHAGRLLCVYPAEFGKFVSKPSGEFKRGAVGSLALTLLDTAGKPVPGRQLVEVTLTDPNGVRHDESGYYRLEDGKVTIPIRPALNDLAGAWKLTLTERTSGLTVSQTLAVK